MTQNFLKNTFLSTILGITFLTIAPNAEAIPYDILDSPQSTTGGFMNNVFHTSYNGSGSGNTLGWFHLDPTTTNTYDPDSGNLQATFNVYNDSAFTSLVGTVFATGNLPAGNFEGNGGLAGSMTWMFDLNGASLLNDYLDGNTNIVTYYQDLIYTTTNNNIDVNSYTDSYLALWGSGELGNNQNAWHLGTDLVLHVNDPHSTPEPITMALFGSGFLGGLGLQRKKQKA